MTTHLRHDNEVLRAGPIGVYIVDHDGVDWYEIVRDAEGWQEWLGLVETSTPRARDRAVEIMRSPPRAGFSKWVYDAVWQTQYLTGIDFADGFLGVGMSGAAFAVRGADRVIKITISAEEADAVETIRVWRKAGHPLPHLIQTGPVLHFMTTLIGKKMHTVKAFARDVIAPLDSRDIASIPRIVPGLRGVPDEDVLRERGGTALYHASNAALEWMRAKTNHAASAALKTYRSMLDVAMETPLTAGVARDVAELFDTSAGDRVVLYDAVPGNTGRLRDGTVVCYDCERLRRRA